MKSIIKRILLYFLVLMLLGLASCGGAEQLPQPQSPTDAPSQEQTPVSLENDPVFGLGYAIQKATGNRQGVYYEVFVRAFADSDGDGIGDINGLISKLDYLNDADPETSTDLGVTGIWLMPVNATVSYHGYDVTDYYAINPDYGTMSDFERLLEEAHKRGITVMMDLVLNHTSDKHEWFISATHPESPYRNWYYWTLDGSEGYNLHTTKWGHEVWNKRNGAYYLGLFWSGMPDLNYDNPEVRQEAKRIAGFWLEKGVDGFRLDAVPHIYDGSEVINARDSVERTVAWWQEFTDYCHEIKPESLIVGEVLDENAVTRATYLASLDATFHIGLGTQIANALKAGKSKNGYLNAYITNSFAQYEKTNPDFLDAPILSNHDQNRFIGNVGGKHELMKVAASIYLTLEGIPFIYYGEEIGMYGAKPDEDIRLPFVWGNDDPCQSKWRASKYDKVIIPASQQEKDKDSLLTHYKRLIRVRNANEALYAGKFHPLTSDNEAVLAYGMTSEHQSAIVVHNLSQTRQTVGLSTEGYSLVFCQAKEGFSAGEGRVSLPPLSSAIFVK